MSDAIFLSIENPLPLAELSLSREESGVSGVDKGGTRTETRGRGSLGLWTNGTPGLCWLKIVFRSPHLLRQAPGIPPKNQGRLAPGWFSAEKWHGLRHCKGSVCGPKLPAQHSWEDPSYSTRGELVFPCTDPRSLSQNSLWCGRKRKWRHFRKLMNLFFLS